MNKFTIISLISLVMFSCKTTPKSELNETNIEKSDIGTVIADDSLTGDTHFFLIHELGYRISARLTINEIGQKILITGFGSTGNINELNDSAAITIISPDSREGLSRSSLHINDRGEISGGVDSNSSSDEFNLIRATPTIPQVDARAPMLKNIMPLMQRVLEKTQLAKKYQTKNFHEICGKAGGKVVKFGDSKGFDERTGLKMHKNSVLPFTSKSSLTMQKNKFHPACVNPETNELIDMRCPILGVGCKKDKVEPTEKSSFLDYLKKDYPYQVVYNPIMADGNLKLLVRSIFDKDGSSSLGYFYDAEAQKILEYLKRNDVPAIEDKSLR